MARLGMERWESNPRPKYDFSAKRAALLRERAEVSQAQVDTVKVVRIPIYDDGIYNQEQLLRWLGQQSLQR